jgi:hypothetical protein
MPAPRAAKSDISDLSTKHQIETQLHGKLEAARIEYDPPQRITSTRLKIAMSFAGQTLGTGTATESWSRGSTGAARQPSRRP